MSQKAQWKNRKKNPTRPARDAAVAKANFFFLFSVSRHVSSSKECRVFIRFPTHVSLVLFKIVNGRSRHEHLNVCLLCLCFNSHIKRIKFWFRFCYSKKKNTPDFSLSLHSQWYLNDIWIWLQGSITYISHFLLCNHIQYWGISIFLCIISSQNVCTMFHISWGLRPSHVETPIFLRSSKLINI